MGTGLESLSSSLFSPLPHHQTTFSLPRRNSRSILLLRAQEFSDPWSLSDGTKKFKLERYRKKPLSDDDARRIIKSKARYLSELRRNQGSQAQTPRWIRRTPEQMVRYIEDDRNGHLYGKHVMAAIRKIRALAGLPEGSYEIREVMSSFVTKLSFREMCTVLKEQRGWRQARDFFSWMKLQLCYRPSVIVYTIMLRLYGQVGKIRLAEETFLEMLEAGCEPDDVVCGTMLCSYARWGRHKDMLVFYNAVRRKNILPSISVFNFMISSLQKKKQHEKVIQLWEHMVDCGVDPTSFTYTVVITSYVKLGFLEEARKTLERMRKSRFIPEEATYGLLINLCIKDGKHDEGLKLYHDMKAWGIVPSNYTCAALLTLYCKNHDYSKALSLFVEMERSKIVVDEVIYGLIIRVYGKLGLYEDAERAFKEVERLGLLKDEKTYAAIVQVYLASGNPKKGLRVFEMMKSRNVELTAFSYSSLLRCFLANEDVESSESTFETLIKFGALDSVSCNELLVFYIRLGLLEKARNLVNRIRDIKVKIDQELYRTVLQVYCKGKSLEDAEKVVDEMETKGYSLDKYSKTSLMAMYGESGALKRAEYFFKSLEKPDAVSLGVMLSLYLEKNDMKSSKDMLKSFTGTDEVMLMTSQLITKFCREGSTEKAEFVYMQLSEMGLRPSGTAISSLIDIYGKQQKSKHLENLVYSLPESTQKEKLVYSSMVNALVNCGKIDKASAACIGILREGHSMDAVTLSVLVNVLSKNGKHQDSETIIKESFQCSATLDTIAYNTYINAMLESGKLHFASYIFDRMISEGIPPTIQTYNTMISVYGRGGNLEKAIEIFNRARITGFPIDEKTYTNMISYYGKSGKSLEASKLFIEMQKEGIRPGKISYNIMISAYITEGQFQEAAHVFQSMKNDGHIPDSLTYLALLQVYVRGQKYLEAEEVIQKMQLAGITPNHSHFNPLISAFTRNGYLEDAKRVLLNMKTAGLDPDLACCRAMIRAYVDYGVIEEGIFFFEQIRKLVKADAYILSAAVHLYNHVGEDCKAKELMCLIEREGVPFLSQLKIGSRTKA